MRLLFLVSKFSDYPARSQVDMELQHGHLNHPLRDEK